MAKTGAHAGIHKGRLSRVRAEPPSSEPAIAGELLTMDEAAARMNMSGRYVRRLVSERRIPFYRFGRSVRLRSTDVDALVEAGRVEPFDIDAVRRHVFEVA